MFITKENPQSCSWVFLLKGGRRYWDLRGSFAHRLGRYNKPLFCEGRVHFVVLVASSDVPENEFCGLNWREQAVFMECQIICCDT